MEKPPDRLDLVAIGATPDEIKLMLKALDALTEKGRVEDRRAAYDLLIRLGASMGSDGRWRVHPERGQILADRPKKV